MKNISFLLASILVLAVCSSAQPAKSFRFKGTSYETAEATNVVWAQRALQGYNFRMWLSNQMRMGVSAWDVSDGSQIPVDPRLGAEYPRGAAFEHLYAASPVIGAIVNGTRRVVEGFNLSNGRGMLLPSLKDTLRERIWQTSTENLNEPNKRSFDDDGDGRIDEDDLDGLDNDGDWNVLVDDLGSDGLPDVRETGCKGEYDVITHPDPASDNYDPAAFDSCRIDPNNVTYPRKNDRNRYTQGNGMADHGEPHVDEDYAAISDNDLYCSATDTFRAPIYFGHVPLGIKVVQRSYAWRNEEFGPILPFDYAIINIGTAQLQNVFVGFFVDADVGPVDLLNYASRNYAGYFAERRTAYIHNPVDRGSTPLGLMLLQVPKPLGELIYTFRWHDFSEPGTIDSLIYTWMSCEKFGGTQCINQNQPISNLTDTRFLYSVGPFDVLNPGDTLKFSVALISGECVEHCPGSLKENTAKALFAHRRGYYDHPEFDFPSPALSIIRERGKAHLKFGGRLPGRPDPVDVGYDSLRARHPLINDQWKRYDSLPGNRRYGRIFEGYRVYRSEDPEGRPGTFVRIHEVDLLDEFAYNIGIDTVYIDSNLTASKTYWYAVTSFTIPQAVVIEVPDTLNGGIRYDTLWAGEHESPILENAQKVSRTLGIPGNPNEPVIFRLYEAYPNPFNPSTTVGFELATTSIVSLRIFDLLGREAADLGSRVLPSGYHDIEWDATGQPSGIYVVRLEVADIAYPGRVYMGMKKVILTR